MMKYTWQEFVAYLATAPLEFPHLRTTVLAQAMLECGTGTSKLFLDHGNPFGMHYHAFQSAYATGVSYEANDGRATYCAFENPANAIRAYFGWFDHWLHYNGWRTAAKKTAADFLHFISPHYCPPGMTESWKARHQGFSYPDYILHSLYPKAEHLLHDALPPPAPTGIATWVRVYALSPDVGLEACDSESRTVGVWRGTSIASALSWLQTHPSVVEFRPAGFAPFPEGPWNHDEIPLPKPPKSLPDHRVALDVGHGITAKQSYDSGATGPSGEHEHKLNLLQAGAAAAYLRDLGVEVDIFSYTQPGEGIDLEARGRRGKGYDCFVSCHLNAANRKAEYSAAFCHKEADEASLRLGKAIANECSKVHGTSDRGAVQYANFSILVGMKSVGVPGCISEACFLDSPGETWPIDATRYGEAIGKGIARFLRSQS